MQRLRNMFAATAVPAMLPTLDYTSTWYKVCM